MSRHLSQGSTMLVTALLFVMTTGVAAQTNTDQPPMPAAGMSKPATSPAKNAEPKPQASDTTGRLTPQQAQLQAEIEKLYQLAQDLKTAVAKSNKDTLSIDVVKKADAVEKAAKSLKDQIRNSQPATAGR